MAFLDLPEETPVRDFEKDARVLELHAWAVGVFDDITSGKLTTKEQVDDVKAKTFPKRTQKPDAPPKPKPSNMLKVSKRPAAMARASSPGLGPAVAPSLEPSPKRAQLSKPALSSTFVPSSQPAPAPASELAPWSDLSAWEDPMAASFRDID